jgi:uncharacterized protein YndB with AHSA1/START domain
MPGERLSLIDLAAVVCHTEEAVTTAEGIRNWWTRDAVFDSKLGGTGQFRFYDGKVTTTVRVDKLEPQVRTGWTTISANAPGGWNGTTITFDLRTEADSTVLSFAHRGLKQADESFAMVNTGWAYYLMSLKRYLEAGKGAPHPDEPDYHPFSNRAASR